MKDYTTPYAKWLALALILFYWLTGDAAIAAQSSSGFIGHIIGSAIAPFVFSAVILLALRLFGVAWSAKVFFFLALGFALLGAMGVLLNAKKI